MSRAEYIQKFGTIHFELVQPAMRRLWYNDRRPIVLATNDLKARVQPAHSMIDFIHDN